MLPPKAFIASNGTTCRAGHHITMEGGSTMGGRGRGRRRQNLSGNCHARVAAVPMPGSLETKPGPNENHECSC